MITLDDLTFVGQLLFAWLIGFGIGFQWHAFSRAVNNATNFD